MVCPPSITKLKTTAKKSGIRVEGPGIPSDIQLNLIPVIKYDTSIQEQKLIYHLEKYDRVSEYHLDQILPHEEEFVAEIERRKGIIIST